MSDRDVLEAVRDRVADLTPRQRKNLARRLTPSQREVLRLALELPHLEPHQRPPPGSWFVWLMLAGRMAGKTYAAAHWFNDHMSGPPCDPRIPGGHRASIIAPTHIDAYDSCIAGPSGLLSINPQITSLQGKSGTVARWPNGGEARLFGAYTPEDVERQRAGGNRCAVWAEELAAWAKLDDVWDHMMFGLRIGPKPRVVASTTPKTRPLLKHLLGRPDVAVTRASSASNPHIVDEVRSRLYERYAGTRLGRQELEGELLTDVEGALWSAERLAELRVIQTPGDLTRIVVGVDPPGSTKAECGIIVCGSYRAYRTARPEFYTLADRSVRGSPEYWARCVVATYHDYEADRVVFEKNCGWEMGLSLLRQVDPNVPVRDVTAKKGKKIRAEPVAALTEQGRAHMVGSFPELEQQLTEWTPEDEESPDRLDAYVWAMSELITGMDKSKVLVSPGGVSSGSYWKH